MITLEDVFGCKVDIVDVHDIYDLTTDTIKNYSHDSDFDLKSLESITITNCNDSTIINISVDTVDIRVYNSNCIISTNSNVNHIYCYYSNISVNATYDLTEIYVKNSEIPLLYAPRVNLLRMVDSSSNYISIPIIQCLDTVNVSIDLIVSHIHDMDSFLSNIKKGSVSQAKKLVFLVGGSRIISVNKIILDSYIFDYITTYLI